jgi:hypothetical protein
MRTCEENRARKGETILFPPQPIIKGLMNIERSKIGGFFLIDFLIAILL